MRNTFRLIARDENTKEKKSVREKRYLCECQTNADSSILIRMFEYAMQTAVDEATRNGSMLWVQVPYCAVLVNLAAKYERMKEEVRTVMGGKVIMTEATRILNRGKEEGRAEGKAEGIAETMLKNLQALMKTMKLTTEQALEMLEVPEEMHAKYLSMLK